MSISLTCDACTKQFKVADTLAGKLIKCPECKAVISVPTKPEEAARDDSDDDPRAKVRRKKSKKRTRPANGGSRLWIPLGVGAALAVAALCVGLAFFLRKPPDPGESDNPGGLAAEMKYFPDDCIGLISIRQQQLLASKAYKATMARFEGARNMGNREGVKDEDMERHTEAITSSGVVVVITTNRSITPDEVKEGMRATGPVPEGFAEEAVGNYQLFFEKGKGSRAFCIPEDKIVLCGRPQDLRPILSRGKRPALSDKFQTAYSEADFTCTKVKIEAPPNFRGFYADATCSEMACGPTMTFKSVRYCKDADVAELTLKLVEAEVNKEKPNETDMDRERRKNAKVSRSGSRVYRSTSVGEELVVAHVKKTNSSEIPAF